MSHSRHLSRFVRIVAGLLLASAATRSARAQTSGGPDLLAEVGVADGGSLSGVALGIPKTSATWFAGATVASAPILMGRGWDFSVAARLAREPVLGMVRAGDRIAPAYFDALRASASLMFVHTSGPFDVAIAGRYAETRIDRSQTADPARNDNGLWTFLFEATAHVRWYAAGDAAAAPARRRLVPIVDLYGGVKHDRRFHRHGDLQPYDDPTGRALGGLFVAAWRWRGRDGAPWGTIGGGVDVETALRSGVRLPSAGRAFLRAAFDLRRLAATARQ